MFPRFFYVSDDSLLSVLSNPMSVSSIQPHLASLFGGMGNLVLADSTSSHGEAPVIIAVASVDGEKLPLHTPVRMCCVLSGIRIIMVVWEFHCGQFTSCCAVSLNGSVGVLIESIVQSVLC